MRSRLRLMRLLFGLSGLLLVMAPGTALAHDNLGGDELAVASWMLIAAMVVIALAALAALWAYKAGQFSNVEESKYSMLDNAEDFDQVMAEADERERALREAERQRQAEQKAPAHKPAMAPESTVASSQQKQAHV